MDERSVWLRKYIFQRLRDSLILNGARFLEVSAVYHFGDIKDQIPAAMRAVALGAVEKIKAEIDAGRPCGLGLVSTSIDPTKSHQVVCYGYNELSDGRIDFSVYDNALPNQACTVQVQLTDDAVLIVHTDRILAWSDDKVVRYQTTSGDPAENPSYCSMLYLDYGAKTPQSALEWVPPLDIHPNRIALGNQVTADLTIKNLGWGIAPPGRALMFDAGNPGRHDELLPGLTAALSTTVVPPRAGQLGASLTYMQVCQAPSQSIVTLLRNLNIEIPIALLGWPGNIDVGIAMFNTMLGDNPSVSYPPAVWRPKLVFDADGDRVSAPLEVRDCNIVLTSDDIGDRCNPLAYPGKRIKVKIDREASVLPDVAPKSAIWHVSSENAIVTHPTIHLGIDEISTTLPKTVGEVVTISMTAYYEGYPPQLSAEMTIVVNNEEQNRMAGQICAVERQVKEMQRKAVQVPHASDPTWAVTQGHGTWVMTNQVVRQIQVEAARAAQQIREERGMR